MSAPAEIHEQMERRSFLGLLLTAIGGVIGAAMAIPLVRFATFPLRGRSGASIMVRRRKDRRIPIAEYACCAND